MAKKEPKPAEEAVNDVEVTVAGGEPVVLDSIAEALETAPQALSQSPVATSEPVAKVEPTPISVPQTHVPFNADQMEIIQQMIKNSQARGGNAPVSVYGQRDPRKIENVKVSTFNGKFVIGFKDLNTNQFRKEPKYSEVKADLVRRLPQEPHVTLLLSNNGTDIEELSVSLVDYMNNREKIEVPVIHIDKQEVIRDHGVLGRVGNDVAIATDENNRPLAQIAIKQESKETIMKFYVNLPGFAHPVEFIEAFLA